MVDWGPGGRGAPRVSTMHAADRQQDPRLPAADMSREEETELNVMDFVETEYKSDVCDGAEAGRKRKKRCTRPQGKAGTTRKTRGSAKVPEEGGRTAYKRRKRKHGRQPEEGSSSGSSGGGISTAQHYPYAAFLKTLCDKVGSSSSSSPETPSRIFSQLRRSDVQYPYASLLQALHRHAGLGAGRSSLSGTGPSLEVARVMRTIHHPTALHHNPEDEGDSPSMLFSTLLMMMVMQQKVHTFSPGGGSTSPGTSRGVGGIGDVLRKEMPQSHRDDPPPPEMSSASLLQKLSLSAERDLEVSGDRHCPSGGLQGTVWSSSESSQSEDDLDWRPTHWLAKKVSQDSAAPVKRKSVRKKTTSPVVCLEQKQSSAPLGAVVAWQAKQQLYRASRVTQGKKQLFKASVPSQGRKQLFKASLPGQCKQQLFKASVPAQCRQQLYKASEPAAQGKEQLCKSLEVVQGKKQLHKTSLPAQCRQQLYKVSEAGQGKEQLCKPLEVVQGKQQLHKASEAAQGKPQRGKSSGAAQARQQQRGMASEAARAKLLQFLMERQQKTPTEKGKKAAKRSKVTKKRGKRKQDNETYWTTELPTEGHTSPLGHPAAGEPESLLKEYLLKPAGEEVLPSDSCDIPKLETNFLFSRLLQNFKNLAESSQPDDSCDGQVESCRSPSILRGMLAPAAAAADEPEDKLSRGDRRKEKQQARSPSLLVDPPLRVKVEREIKVECDEEEIVCKVECEEDAFECQVCHLQFSSLSDLSNHQVLFHCTEEPSTPAGSHRLLGCTVEGLAGGVMQGKQPA